MKVKELIWLLQACNPDSMVMVDGYEGGFTELRYVKREIRVELNANKVPSVYGEHELASSDLWADKEHALVTYLPRS